MPLPFDGAIGVITRYIEHWVPGVAAARVGDTLTIQASRGADRVAIPYDTQQLRVLEQAIADSSLPAGYKNGVIRDSALRALYAVGVKGMAPDIEVSKLITDEDLEWNTRVRVTVSFDPETAKKLYEELKALDAVAQELSASDLPLPDIASEHEVMASIIEYFEKEGHLNSPDITGKSLSYLKAAALSWILELEAQKRATSSPRVRAAQSIRLFDLLERFWLLRPWDRIPLPPIVRDYLAQRGDLGKVVPSPGPSLDVGPQLRKLDTRLEERWRGAWQALQSQNPDKVSQAANSMVEVLDKVIDRVCAGKPFKDVLAARYPQQEKVVLAKLAYVSALKSSLQSVKHETNPQSVDTAQDLMHAAEGIIRTLLR
jgi:hypothetical protein